MLTWAIVSLIKAVLKSGGYGKVEPGCILAMAIAGDVIIVIAVIWFLSTVITKG